MGNLGLPCAHKAYAAIACGAWRAHLQVPQLASGAGLQPKTIQHALIGADCPLDLSLPENLYLWMLQSSLLHDLAGSELIPPMYDVHLHSQAQPVMPGRVRGIQPMMP